MQTTLGNRTSTSTNLTPVQRKTSNNIFSNFKFNRKAFEGKGLLVLIAVLQIIMILLIINPVALIQQFQNQQLINEVAGKVEITSGETPVIATVTNPDELRNANGAQAQVYKDAEMGDYVLGYSDRLIIYRRSTGTIIYDGVTPSGLVNEAQQAIIEKLTTKAKDRSLISQDSTEIPQISLITDIDTLRKTDPAFYAPAKNNDIVGLFAQAQIIVLYNQESDSIVNTGKYSTSIQGL